MKKRILSLFLAALMLSSALQLSAFASDQVLGAASSAEEEVISAVNPFTTADDRETDAAATTKEPVSAVEEEPEISAAPTELPKDLSSVEEPEVSEAPISKAPRKAARAANTHTVKIYLQLVYSNPNSANGYDDSGIYKETSFTCISSSCSTSSTSHQVSGAEIKTVASNEFQSQLKEHYVLDGWSKYDELQTNPAAAAHKFTSPIVSKNATLYIVAVPQTYTVTYNYNNSSAYDQHTGLSYGEKTPAPAVNPARKARIYLHRLAA